MDLKTAIFLFGEAAVKNKSTKVYYLVRGIKREKSLIPPTEKQLKQRLKLGIAAGFISQAREVIDIGYANVRRKGWISQGNLVSRHLLKDAVIGEYPDLEIDYSKVLLSNGYLPKPTSANFFVGPDGVLKICWQYTPMFDENWDDELVVFVYSDKFKKGVSHIGKARRKDLSVYIELPGIRGGEVFHCWVFMVGKGGKKVSGSLYFRGEMG